MSFLEIASLTLIFLTLKEATFSFYYDGVKYNATIVVSEHNLPLGKFNIGQALTLAKRLATGAFVNIPPVRIGADDYTLSIVAA